MYYTECMSYCLYLTGQLIQTKNLDERVFLKSEHD